MTRHHRLRPFLTALQRGTTLLALPSMLVLGISAANAEDVYGGIPIKKCADGTVVFTGGSTGPFNPNGPGADPCDEHGGSAGINDPATQIPLDPSATTLVCQDVAESVKGIVIIDGGSHCITSNGVDPHSLPAESVKGIVVIEGGSNCITSNGDDPGEKDVFVHVMQVVDPHFAQTCDTITTCGNGEQKCSVEDLVTFKVGFPEIDASDVTIDNIGIAHNILLDAMNSRVRAFEAAGNTVDDVALTNIYRAVARDLHTKQGMAALANTPDLDEVRTSLTMSLADGFESTCKSTGKAAGKATALPTCSGEFVDLMSSYGDLLEDLGPHDFDGAKALISDLRADAALTLSGSEQDAARVFANVYDASMTYWATQKFDASLRASDADAFGAAVYYVVNVINGPYNGDLDADSASFGAFYSLVSTMKF